MNLPESELSALSGVHDQDLRLLEDAFGVEIAARGGVVSPSGGPEGTKGATHLLSEFSKLTTRGYVPKKVDIPSARDGAASRGAKVVEDAPDDAALGYEGDHPHLALTAGTGERPCFLGLVGGLSSGGSFPTRSRVFP